MHPALFDKINEPIKASAIRQRYRQCAAFETIEPDANFSCDEGQYGKRWSTNNEAQSRHVGKYSLVVGKWIPTNTTIEETCGIGILPDRAEIENPVITAMPLV